MNIVVFGIMCEFGVMIIGLMFVGCVLVGIVVEIGVMCVIE